MTTAELEQTLGNNVRKVRIDRRMTQAELADAANVSLGALKNLESGRGATTKTLVRVLSALKLERWLDTLAPVPVFNPLTLLEERRAKGRSSERRRVRHRSVDRT